MPTSEEEEEEELLTNGGGASSSGLLAQLQSVKLTVKRKLVNAFSKSLPDEIKHHTGVLRHSYDRLVDVSCP